MHVDVEPAIFYWGTPVVLVSTLNADGTTNIAPMSSACSTGRWRGFMVAGPNAATGPSSTKTSPMLTAPPRQIDPFHADQIACPLVRSSTLSNEAWIARHCCSGLA